MERTIFVAQRGFAASGQRSAISRQLLPCGHTIHTLSGRQRPVPGAQKSSRHAKKQGFSNTGIHACVRA
jgi:hypothetical protein